MTNTLECRKCGDPLADVADEGITQGTDGPQILVYRCPRCEIKAVVIFEPTGGVTPEQESWVQREVAARGHFFPSDFTVGGSFGRLR